MEGVWPEVELGAVADDVTVGHVGSMVTEYIPVGIPFLRSLNVAPHRIETNDIKFISAEFHGRLKKSALRPGDVVIVRTGKPGTAAVIPSTLPEANCSDLVVVRPGPRLDPRFLAYFVNSQAQGHVDAHTVGAVQQHFNIGSARLMKVPLPPLDEQRAIAGVLGALDDKIEANRRMNATLEAMARALFKSWFVDFDPVRAKMEGREPALDPDLAALFPARLTDSPLGPIPERWEVRPLTDLFDLNPRASLQPAADAAYVDMAALPTSGARVHEIARRTPGSGARFTNGDVLLARITPCLENGKTALVDFLEDGETGWGSTEFIVFRPKAHLPTTWMYSLARTGEFRTFAIQNMSGTSGRQRVGSDAFRTWTIASCPAPVGHAFGRITQPWFAAMKAHDDQSRTLAQLRDLLLPKLLSGALRVKDAERLVDQAGG